MARVLGRNKGKPMKVIAESLVLDDMQVDYSCMYGKAGAGAVVLLL